MGVRVREAKVAHKHIAPPARNSWKKNSILPPPITGVGMTWETAVHLGRVYLTQEGVDGVPRLTPKLKKKVEKRAAGILTPDGTFGSWSM